MSLFCYIFPHVKGVRKVISIFIMYLARLLWIYNETILNSVFSISFQWLSFSFFCVSNMQYLLNEQYFFLRRVGAVSQKDLSLNSRFPIYWSFALKKVCNFFKLWFSLLENEDNDFSLLWISWDCDNTDKTYGTAPGTYVRGWLFYSIWSSLVFLDPIMTPFKFRYFHLYLCMIANPEETNLYKWYKCKYNISILYVNIPNG